MENNQQEQEMDFDVPSELRRRLDLAAETGEAMFETELTQKNSQHFERSKDRRKEFKALLRQLYFWYEPKFQYTEEMETPDLLEDMDSAQDVWQLDFEECQTLFRTIRDLMEHIGHTKFETEKHSDKGY